MRYRPQRLRCGQETEATHHTLASIRLPAAWKASLSGTAIAADQDDMTEIVDMPEKPDQPSMAFCCPRCHFDMPAEAPEEVNPSTDRWFTCPSCGYKWTVSPIADSN